MIIERYIIKEVVEFCSNNFSEKKSIGIPNSCHDDRVGGRGTQDLNVKLMARNVVLEAHFYILNNLSEVEPYIATHKTVINKEYPEWMTSGCWRSITRNSLVGLIREFLIIAVHLG